MKWNENSLLDTKSCHEYLISFIFTISLVGPTRGLICKIRIKSLDSIARDRYHSIMTIANLKKIGKCKFSTQNDDPQKHVPAKWVWESPHVHKQNFISTWHLLEQLKEAFDVGTYLPHLYIPHLRKFYISILNIQIRHGVNRPQRNH